MTDRFSVRAVVVILGIIAVVGMVLIGILALDEKGVPDSLTAVTSAAAGALGALLARTSVAPDADDFGGGGG